MHGQQNIKKNIYIYINVCCADGLVLKQTVTRLRNWWRQHCDNITQVQGETKWVVSKNYFTKTKEHRRIKFV